MKITHVRIRNILGFTSFEFEPGSGYTEITGPNGEGKTSVATVIKSLGVPGHDSTLLTAGQDQGEMVYVLDDGTEITKTITQDATDVKVRANGKLQKRPAELIAALIDKVACNPIEMLRADKKRRVQVLLESMPIEVDYVRLEEIVGFEVARGRAGVHGLHVIDDVRKQIYDMRTGTNGAVKQKEATIKQLTDAMPQPVDGVIGGETEIESQIEALDNALAAEKLRVEGKLSNVRTASNEKLNSIRATADQQIAELQRQIEEIRDQRDIDVAKEQQSLKDIESLAARQSERTTAKHAADKMPLSSQLQVLKNNRDNAARREQTQLTIDTMGEELVLLTQEADSQTGMIDAIDAYKLELLANLPIPNIEVRGDEIYRNNVIFERLNTQQQTEIVVDIAKLRAGKLGVICIDGLEVLDTEHYEAFKQAALQDPSLQFFITRVSDEPFAVRSHS